MSANLKDARALLCVCVCVVGSLSVSTLLILVCLMTLRLFEYILHAARILRRWLNLCTWLRAPGASHRYKTSALCAKSTRWWSNHMHIPSRVQIERAPLRSAKYVQIRYFLYFRVCVLYIVYIMIALDHTLTRRPKTKPPKRRNKIKHNLKQWPGVMVINHKVSRARAHCIRFRDMRHPGTARGSTTHIVRSLLCICSVIVKASADCLYQTHLRFEWWLMEIHQVLRAIYQRTTWTKRRLRWWCRCPACWQYLKKKRNHVLWAGRRLLD